MTSAETGRAETRRAEPRRKWPTLVVWLLHLCCLATVAGFAALFLLMATSLDPVQIVTSGVEPYTNALVWTLAVFGVALVSAIGLLLWHSRRLRTIGIGLLAVEMGAIALAGARIFNDYF